MKASFDENGNFEIIPENSLEVFALKCWKEKHRWGESETRLSATITIKKLTK
ncbi:hypothetical protein [Tenacibaculum ovolyticum]|uniref:hypothetical protein n=1 Tax=Tenacibaculum ovolyticum TaxID=104270 RepID=UPI0003FA3347|nr:hypothetical protein [Tenacibaculum ovolyticum]